MNLPMQTTNLGKVLRAMHNAGPMSAGHIRRKAGLHPDTAVTARIRDLRKMGLDVPAYPTPHETDPHKRVWHYKIERMPRWVDDALRAEKRRMMGVAA